ncbi:MAG TPA: thermonuclease family protein [Hadesarchaea archaeon]|nr:thermonuclease family protein [Hadesarchaea archaeon]
MKKVFMILACGVVVLVCVALIVGYSTSSPAQHLQGQPHIEQIATVDYVVDGDTINLQGGEKVRLVGVDAPETSPSEGSKAREFIENFCPPGVVIGLDVDDLNQIDRYGRTIAVVYAKIEGFWVNLNAELLRRGYAKIMFIPPSEFNPYKWFA